MKSKADEFPRVYARLEDLPKGDVPEVAVAGRSNVGKSSLLNTLLGRRTARVSQTPGKTQTINLYPTQGAFRIADLPGYGYARTSKGKREAWGRLIEGYLSGRETLRGVLLLIDARHPPTGLDVQMSRWLLFYGIHTIYVATKADRIARGERVRKIEKIREALELDRSATVYLFSSRTGEGKEALWRAVLDLTASARKGKE
jgi:GTP-binding protein